MNETKSIKADLLHGGWILLWWVIGNMWAFSLWGLGFHGDWVFGLTNTMAMATAVAVSKPRREHFLQIVGAARGRVLRLGRTLRSWQERRSRIARAPVSRLDRIARLLFPKAYERVFKPARADILHEWQRAEAAGDHKRVRMLKYVHGPVSMLQHMVAQVPVSILKFLINLWKNQ